MSGSAIADPPREHVASVSSIVISSIQPVGTGTEVRLNEGKPEAVVEVAPHRGALTTTGVPQELVRRFLGRRFTRQELTVARAAFLDDERIVYRWLGQTYFLAPA